MTDTGSVTVWIDRLKAGEPQSSQELWERYVDRLLRLARKKFGRSPRRVTDEEDVVLSAFDGFFRGVHLSRFPQLEDRDDLWQLLVMLTDRKTIDHRRREMAAKRGGGNVRGESAIAGGRTHNSDLPGLSQVVDSEPSPEFAVEFAEELKQSLELLADDILQKVAMGKMEGYTNAELAQTLGLNVRSIERKLQLIRRVWHEKDII